MHSLRFPLALAAFAAALPFQASSAAAEANSVVAPVSFTAFADPALDQLLVRALTHNADLATAAARVDQARALAGAARADFYPQLAADGFAGRGRSLDTQHRTGDYAHLPGVAGWELDLWGRIRKSVTAARADAGTATAHYVAAQLSLAAEVTQTYFTLRATVLEQSTVESSITTRREARRIIADRTEIGTSSPLDLARADTELAHAQAELAAVGQRRAALGHALAVLTGDGADSFELGQDHAATSADLPRPPEIPAGLPATLLQRRPDVFAAQLAMDAASARIGVARAAFFPTIALTGSAGWESADFSNVISGDTRVWSFGPRVYLPLFQGGRNRANLNRAAAAFAEQAARYRQTVLLAFRDVRDALSATRYLAEQTDATERAAVSARRAAALSRARYDAGAVSYLEVVDADRARFETERTLTRLQGQRLVATAALIRALGGGWFAAELSGASVAGR